MRQCGVSTRSTTETMRSGVAAAGASEDECTTRQVAQWSPPVAPASTCACVALTAPIAIRPTISTVATVLRRRFVQVIEARGLTDDVAAVKARSHRALRLTAAADAAFFCADPAMRTRLRNFLGLRARALSAFACLLAVSMQLALPVLHQTHGGHEARLASHEVAAGSIREASHHEDHSAKHEPATCPQCRMVSHGVAPVARTIGVAAPDLRASFAPAFVADFAHRERSGHEGPPRAPPLSA